MFPLFKKILKIQYYTHLCSKFGDFANPGASDFPVSKQPLSEGHRGDADAEKDEDARAGKIPKF
jgi:hypothetical protein